MKICPVCSTEYADDVKFCPNDGQTLRSAAPGGASDLVGQVIADRYHVMKKLGEGGMGQVYLAEHVKMGRRSAIKVMNPAMVHDPDAVARFNREASNASRISHPNVCAIYDFGETPDGLIFLAMEFIEGQPLTGLVVGTPEFMSPEQLAGDALDGRSDLYSLALVFYRMLIGKLPFEATSVQETMIKRLTDEPIKLAEARPDLSFPAGLQPVLDTALARTPMERYQSVAKFAADVAAVTGRPTTGAVPRTHSKGDAEAKTQLLAPISAAAASRKKRSLIPVVAGVVVILAGGGAWMALNGGSKANPNRADTSRSVARDTAGTQTTPQNGGRAVRQVGGASRAPDSATYSKRLDDVLQLVLDPHTAGTGRIQATAVYDDDRAPATLRAQAAFMVAQAFFVESGTDQACAWNARALRLKPQNEVYLKFKRDQACGS